MEDNAQNLRESHDTTPDVPTLASARMAALVTGATDQHEVRREYAKHGLHAARAALKARGRKAIDGRSSLGYWRRQLVKDLGGKATLSAAKMALIDAATATKAQLDLVDAYLAEASWINRRRRAAIPVMQQRLALEAALFRTLDRLGLERRPASLREVLQRPK